MKNNIETMIEAMKKMKKDIAKIRRNFVIIGIITIGLTLALLIWIILFWR